MSNEQSTDDVEQIVIAEWRKTLLVQASDLDFSLEDDRSTFRQRLGWVTERTSMFMLRRLADAVGAPSTPGNVSRGELTRTLADAYMAWR